MKITKRLETVSSSADFEVKTSPQSEALDWIIYDDQISLCPGDDKLVQRYALTVIYFALGGDFWMDCGRFSSMCEGVKFLSEDSECAWDGILCDDDGFVKEIHLDEKGMAGTIPDEITHLTNLMAIDMDDNDIYGSIPATIGSLKKLRVLDFDKNVMTGSIPESLYELKTLEVLDINNNRFDGSISTKIGNLHKLEFFQLHNNFFDQTIPSSFGRLKKIEILTFNGNGFNGEIPKEVCDLKKSGELKQLWADCGNPEKIICACCNRCY